MAIGDGTAWDEASPTNATIATSIDEYNRDVRIGVRSRLAIEHEFPASQSATSEAGSHKYISLQMQSTEPGLVTGTQTGQIYQKTVGTTGDALFFMNLGTQEINLSKKLYFWYLDESVATGTNVSASLYLISDGKIHVARGVVSTTASGGAGIQVDINYNGTSIWTATASQVILAGGSTSTNVTGFVTTNVTAGGILTMDVDKVGTGTAGGNLTVMLEVG